MRPGGFTKSSAGSPRGLIEAVTVSGTPVSADRSSAGSPRGLIEALPSGACPWSRPVGHPRVVPAASLKRESEMIEESEDDKGHPRVVPAASLKLN